MVTIDRKIYRVNLKRMAALCEANYLRLQRLARVAFPAGLGEQAQAPEFVTGRRGVIEMPDYAAALCLQVCDTAPYTTTLQMHIRTLAASNALEGLNFCVQENADDASGGLSAYDFAAPMLIRLYHDLRMAEITDYAGQGAGKSRYSYPNAQMLAVDERNQQNMLLGEWLARALAAGLVGSEQFEPAVQAHWLAASKKGVAVLPSDGA